MFSNIVKYCIIRSLKSDRQSLEDKLAMYWSTSRPKFWPRGCAVSVLRHCKMRHFLLIILCHISNQIKLQELNWTLWKSLWGEYYRGWSGHNNNLISENEREYVCSDQRRLKNRKAHTTCRVVCFEVSDDLPLRILPHALSEFQFLIYNFNVLRALCCVIPSCYHNRSVPAERLLLVLSFSFSVSKKKVLQVVDLNNRW